MVSKTFGGSQFVLQAKIAVHRFPNFHLHFFFIKYFTCHSGHKLAVPSFSQWWPVAVLGAVCGTAVLYCTLEFLPKNRNRTLLKYYRSINDFFSTAGRLQYFFRRPHFYFEGFESILNSF